VRSGTEFVEPGRQLVEDRDVALERHDRLVDHPRALGFVPGRVVQLRAVLIAEAGRAADLVEVAPR
jgi:hypothetical protein